jgi:hypothetical protein
MFRRFPKVDVVAIDGSFGEKACQKLTENLKNHNKDIRIVAFLPSETARCGWADETVSSHDPAALLKLLQEMGGRTDI